MRISWVSAFALALSMIQAGSVFSNGEEAGRELKVDPLISNLPNRAAEVFKARFPNCRLWQISQTGRGDTTEYDLIVFDPHSTVVHAKQVDSAFVTGLLSSHLVIQGNGTVVREDPHPVSERDIPAAARAAFEKWSARFQGTNRLVDWSAFQNGIQQERLYSVRVVLSAVEGYSATFKGDGTFMPADEKK